MEKIQYKLEVFEGPMDLLLQLISKKQVSINDVPIMEIIEQYLDYMNALKDYDMEITGEFMEMAARLIYIKTVSLLPVEEEAEKLVEELRGELIEYRDCKIVAGKLRETGLGFDYHCREPEEIEVDMTYTRIHEPYDIFKAYISAVGKGLRKLPPPIEAFSGIVAHKIVSVTSRMRAIKELFRKKEKYRFDDFFSQSESRSEMVATFLAILTMVKKKNIYIDGDTDNPELVWLQDSDEDTDGEEELEID